MIDFLATIGLPSLFVLTKADKPSRRDRDVRIPALIDQIGVDRNQVRCSLPRRARDGGAPRLDRRVADRSRSDTE